MTRRAPASRAPDLFTIGIDVGGTFTDLVAIDESGRTVFAKSPSTPADQSVGVMAGLDELARRLGLTRATMLAATERIVHGTTVATNALLERKGAKVALLTTEGHRDVLEMREGLKGDRYDLRSPPPEPLVPRDLRFGVRERLRPDGSVAIPLDEASLDAAIGPIRRSGATSVAICYLHAYRNPAHEIAAAERLRARTAGRLRLALERRAAADQGIRARLDDGRERLCRAGGAALSDGARSSGSTEAGLNGRPLHHPVAWRHGARRGSRRGSRPRPCCPGPAGGIAGARRCAELLGVPDLIPFDMGGTSTDISLIADGQAALSADGARRRAHRAAQPRHRQHRGRRRLDRPRRCRRHLPRRAGKRGRRAGPRLLRPRRPGRHRDRREPGARLSRCGGLHGRPAAARPRRGGGRASTASPTRSGLSRDEAAAGIYRLINLKMADGIRLMTLAPRRRSAAVRAALLRRRGRPARRRGRARTRDPARHRADRRLGAVGLGHAGERPALRGQPHPCRRRARASDGRSARRVRATSRQQAAGRLRSWFDGPIEIERSAEMRYGEQIFEIDVAARRPRLGRGLVWSSGSRTASTAGTRSSTPTPRATRRWCSSMRASRRSARSRSAGRTARPTPSAAAAPRSDAAGMVRRLARRAGLRARRPAAGTQLAGPAIVEAETTTVVVDEGDRVSVNGLGWLDIELG